jgi:hypothetical protein
METTMSSLPIVYVIVGGDELSLGDLTTIAESLAP